MTTNNKDSDLPKDLAGWQALALDEIIKDGDLWVEHGKPSHFVGYSVGCSVGTAYRACSASIYRKIPVAKQGDIDPSWREASDKLHDQMGEVGIDSVAGRAKASTHDEGKPPLARLPWKALDEMANVQAYGYGKYGEWDNWKKGLEVTRNASCALRHIRDYLNGCNEDHESKCHPLAHAMIRLAYIIQNEKDGTARDDRSKPIPDHNGSGLGKEPSPSTKTP